MSKRLETTMKMKAVNFVLALGLTFLGLMLFALLAKADSFTLSTSCDLLTQQCGLLSAPPGDVASVLNAPLGPGLLSFVTTLPISFAFGTPTSWTNNYGTGGALTLVDASGNLLLVGTFDPSAQAQFAVGGVLGSFAGDLRIDFVSPTLGGGSGVGSLLVAYDQQLFHVQGVTLNVVATPEPGTIALFGLGLLSLIRRLRR